MAFSTVVSYFAGLGMLRWDANERARKWCLVLPIVTDLALLAFFKYADFALDTFRSLSTWAGSPIAVPHFHVLLPIGISFYTFHTISYVVDAYRRVITPSRRFFEFSCYVSLFCQLVAGPIVRFRQIENDLDAIAQAGRKTYWNRGWSFFAIGMAKKVLLADTIASIVDPAFARYATLSTSATWLVVLGYTAQIYFDFSGYSDMATGLGALFGLRIPQNFNSPYKAKDPSDFWRRWHISLSTCLRDYVYIPLGGNRSGEHRNLLLTMLIGGVWHGANWTFVAWGAYHGLLLLAYKRFRRPWDSLPAPARQLGMLLLVAFGWVLFRSDSFGMAMTIARHMFVPPSEMAPLVGASTLAVFVAGALLVAARAKNTFEMSHEWPLPEAVGIAALFAASLATIAAAGNSPFLYFQF
jgi:alginate O-acetyltransferase complex protein AlgI